MSFHSIATLQIRGEILSLHRPLVMGILNVTPDSFYQDSRALAPNEALNKALEMINQGVDILDLGAASSRPGADTISVEEEIDRLISVIAHLRTEGVELPISVDTVHAAVAEAAVEAGADIVNDISAGEGDPDMLKTVAKLAVPYILMHMQGKPETMQQDPRYDEVVEEVFTYLSSRIAAALKAGIRDVIIDPGFGFGKNDQHNYALLRTLNQFQHLQCPILVGLSRKSMIQRALDVSASEALNGTTALNMYALSKGAQILRVHDVLEAKQCVRLHHALHR